jgi:hypothetical protein
MSERHFDLAPFPGGPLEGLGFLKGAHMLAFGFEQIARDDPLCSFGAARLQCAGSAILSARPIGYSAVLAHQAGAFELFLSGADEDIGRSMAMIRLMWCNSAETEKKSEPARRSGPPNARFQPCTACARCSKKGGI